MLYFDIAIIAGEIAGLVLSIEKHGFWKQFRYYTQWSNYLLCPILAIASLPFLRPMGKKDRDGTIHLSAITSGGSQAMFFKINTFGEQAFLDKLAQVL